MKFYKFLIFGLLAFLVFEVNSQNLYDNYGLSDTIEGLCKIKKIKKPKYSDGYAIYAEAETKVGTGVFVIVSLMADEKIEKKKLKRIKRNKLYYFKLFSYHPHKGSEGILYTAYLIDYQEVYINWKTIIIDKTHYLRAVYTTPNLNGLYYIKPEIIDSTQLTPKR